MKLENISAADLRRELARREKGAGKLQKQHAKLSARLAALEASLADLGVDGAPARRKPRRPAGKRGPGRPKGSKNKPGKVGRPKGSKNRGPGRPKGSKNKRAKNELSLAEAIVKGVRAGSTVSPDEAGAAARKVGYRSSSPNFGMMVANALAKDSRFKRIGRGQYRLARGKASANSAAKKPGRKPGRMARKSMKKAEAATAADVVARGS
jgi:hypothetical protein